MDRTVQSVHDFHIVQDMAVVRIGLHPNGVGDGASAVFAGGKRRGHFGHGCTSTGRKGDGVAVPLVGLGVNIRRVLKISLCRDAGVCILQLDPVCQSPGFVGCHIADVPDQRAGFRRAFTCGIRDGFILRGCRTDVDASGASGFRGAIRIIGSAGPARHAHIFLDVLGIRKGIHHLDLRAAIRASRHGQGVSQIIAVCLFRDGRDGFGQVHIAVLGNNVTVKINGDRCLANDNSSGSIFADLRQVNFCFHKKVAADDGIRLCLLLCQPCSIKGESDRIVCHRDGAHLGAAAGDFAVGRSVAKQRRKGIGHLPVCRQKGVDGDIAIADLQLEIRVAGNIRRA